MAANVAGVNLMTDQASFITILTAFGLNGRTRTRFTEDFPTAGELMLSTKSQVKDVILNQNKLYRNHEQQNQRCYITAMHMSRILAFRKWAVIAVKEGGANYVVGDVGLFDLAWITGIQEHYLQDDPAATAPGELPVKVPKFNGQNWYETKSALTMALASVYGNSGIPLSYLVRVTRRGWEDTEHYASLQQRRIDTKEHSGAEYSKDNSELYRILGQEFDGTTLEDIVKGIQQSDGVEAWNAILGNVEGANYRTELRRKAEGLVSAAFYDPDKNFSFEDYFQRHTRYHDMMSKAGAPVQDWQKIEKFMSGVRCSQLQTVYITSTMTSTNMTFTQFYNDIHEKYRRLVDTKQLKPASIYSNKRRISQLGTDDNGGRGRGRGHGRGRGRGNGKSRGGRGRGRGRGGRGGRGRGDYDDTINWSVIPSNVDVNGSLDFDDNTWYSFSSEVKDELKKLRTLKRQQKNINSMLQYPYSGQQQHRSNDSTFGGTRGIFDINIPNGLPPPPPSGELPAQPTQGQSHSVTRSTSAGSAFGRRS